MSSLQAEYQRFLVYLAGQPVHDDVRRMANLVMANLRALAEVGAQRRGRSTRLAPLALQQLAHTTAELPGATQLAQASRSHLRLDRLEVARFEGSCRPNHST